MRHLFILKTRGIISPRCCLLSVMCLRSLYLSPITCKFALKIKSIWMCVVNTTIIKRFSSLVRLVYLQPAAVNIASHCSARYYIIPLNK